MEKPDLDEVLFNDAPRWQIWAHWLLNLEDSIKHTSDVDVYLQDYRREDIEPEARLMCEFLAWFLQNGGIQ